MIRVLVRRADGSQVQGTRELATADGTRWIDVQAATAEELGWLGNVFGFHPLALEDCAHLDQRPKADEYPGHLFVVVHEFTIGDDTAALNIHELHCFLGPDYLVTVHADDVPALTAVWTRATAASTALARGTDFVLYELCDAVADSHFRVADAIAEAVEALEDSILERATRRDLGRIFEFKHSLVEFKRVVSPTRDVIGLLTKRGHPCVTEKASVYFRDVFDHLVRVAESIDSDRDLLSNALEAYLSIAANRTSDITKQLTLFASIFLPLSFLAGFFGMNFGADVMLTARPAVFYVLVGVMVAVPVGMVAWFRHKGWF